MLVYGYQIQLGCAGFALKCLCFEVGWIRNFAIRNFASKITFVFREIFVLFREISQPYFAK
jgi:hypothetical protein